MCNKILPGLLLAASVLFTGCAASTANKTPQTAAIYQPKLPQGVTTLDAAEEQLATLMKKAYWISYGRNSRIPDANALRRFVENREGELGTSTNFQYFDDGKVTCRLADGIHVSGGRLAVPIFPIYFDELVSAPGTVDSYSIDGLPHKISISFSGGHTEGAKTAQEVADLIFYIQQHWEPFQQKKFAEFEKKAALYRAIPTKPPMSEEQRKFVVQANAFTERKEYDRAISLYQKAIELDPVSYPPAYLNLALLSAQIQLYKPAIRHMKRYLLLVPDAQDARNAQDKIYEWEAMSNQ